MVGIVKHVVDTLYGCGWVVQVREGLVGNGLQRLHM